MHLRNITHVAVRFQAYRLQPMFRKDLDPCARFLAVCTLKKLDLEPCISFFFGIRMSWHMSG